MELIRVVSVGQLSHLLEEAGVPVGEWGSRRNTKSVEALFREWELGECTLHYEGGRVVRFVHTVCLDVFWGTRQLIEVKQVLPGGGERSRAPDTSLSEKMKPGEDAEICLMRMLREEYPALLRSRPMRMSTRVQRKGSQSYPGVPCTYRLSWFEVRVIDGASLPLVVVETKEDGSEGMTVYYEWRDPLSLR